MQSTQSKVVLITGGSRGIGSAIVDRFKKEGWKVATCATSISGLQESIADFKFKCDVGKREEVLQGLKEVFQALGQIDVLINNAGLSGSNPMGPESSDDLWHRIIDVNLNGTYYMCKYATPYLPDQTGRIINIASVLGLKGVPDQTAYCAAKHGVIGFTRALAHLLAPRKITVNAICPGWVRTEMAAFRMHEIGISEKDLKTQVPLGRFIEPHEIADFAYFLSTAPASAMITGQALTLDGGTLP